MATRTIENYLKNLYLEQQQTPPEVPVAMGRFATIMNVVPGTATTMVKVLADSGLVHYSPRSGVRLTDAGNQLALHVLRRHRLLELFLVRVVGLDWSEVHEEAEELEHVISDKLLERIDSLLGHPTTDPHGDPIPSSTGQLPPAQSETFASCPVGQPIEIVRVLDQEPLFLQFVHSRGLVPGTRLEVRQRDLQADAVTVCLTQGDPGATLTLGTAVARKFVVTSSSPYSAEPGKPQ